MHTELKLKNINLRLLLISYAERRLHFALGRFGSRIGRVTLTLLPSSTAQSKDLTCRVVADLHPFGAVMAEAADIDAYSAIDRAVGKLVRRCHSKCARQRSGTDRWISVRVPGDRLAA